MNIPVMKENQLSLFGKTLVALSMSALVIVASLNIGKGAASHPGHFVIL